MIREARRAQHGAAGHRRPDSSAPEARSRILDAAEGLFAAHGFDATSTARIAHAAAVPKGLLFYYFPAKDDILTSLLDERLSDPGLDAARLAVPGDPVQALLNVAEQILRDHAASDVLREIVWHEAHVRPEAREALTRYRHAVHAAIERVIVASVPGHVDERACAAAAAAWGATVTARPLDARMPHGPASHALHATDSLRQIARLLCAGLAADARLDCDAAE